MKACIICFDFFKSNICRQPWKYVYELCKNIAQNGIDLRIISNGNKEMLGNEAVDDITTYYVNRLTSIFGWSKEVLLILKKENPDVVVILLGINNSLKLNLKIDKPAIGILTSPIYSLREVIGLGSEEITKHFRCLLIHLVGALIPRFLIRRLMNSFERIVALSKMNKKRLENCGVNSEKIVVIPPGIGESDLKLPDEEEINEFRKKFNPEGIPIILYFGSPLTLRGTDILIKAFVKLLRKIQFKLIILSRLEYKELAREEDVLRNILRKEGIINSVKIISGLLRREELKKYISIANVICLPFKLVISDVPITILEAMAMGKPIISTNVDGVAELLEGRGLIVKPNDPYELAKSTMIMLTNHGLAEKLGNNARNYALGYPTWQRVGERFIDLMKDVLQRRGDCA